VTVSDCECVRLFVRSFVCSFVFALLQFVRRSSFVVRRLAVVRSFVRCQWALSLGVRRSAFGIRSLCESGVWSLLCSFVRSCVRSLWGGLLWSVVELEFGVAFMAAVRGVL